MPFETQEAINWALTQSYIWNVGTEWEYEVQVTKDTPMELVSKVREYFNINTIPYNSFSYADLIQYL